MAALKSTGRGPGRKFVKGKSGNPKGRPKTLWEFQQMHQEDEEAYYLRLKIIAMTARPMDALKAIELSYAYGRGRPKVTTEVTGPDGAPLIPSRDDAIHALRAVTAPADAVESGEPVDKPTTEE